MHSNPLICVDGTLLAELPCALAESSLAVHYQPIVDLERREVVGVEALVRWPHPERGLLLPAVILPLAAQAGLTSALGLWVLETACRQAAGWAAQGLRLEVAVNLSGPHLADPNLVEDVRRVLVDTGVEPSQVLLEITELALTDDLGTGPALDSLAELGVTLGLDDFGTGHSSLLYLKRYPITVLKVDTVFVAGLGANRDDEAIVAGVASLAAALEGRCIAEGVETSEQQAHLVALHCQAQGQHFSPAVPAADLPAAIDRVEALLETPLETAFERRQQPSPRGRTRRSAPDLPGDVAVQMLQLHRDGASLQTIAAALNQLDAPNPKGTRWHGRSVARYLPLAAAMQTTGPAMTTASLRSAASSC